MTNEVFRSLSAASTISGYRSDQLQPRRVSSRTLAFTLNDQAIAVMLDFVKPIRAGGDFGGALEYKADSYAK